MELLENVLILLMGVLVGQMLYRVAFNRGRHAQEREDTRRSISKSGWR